MSPDMAMCQQACAMHVLHGDPDSVIAMKCDHTPLPEVLACAVHCSLALVLSTEYERTSLPELLACAVQVLHPDFF